MGTIILVISSYNWEPISIFNIFFWRFDNWAREASPTLGCSIEISRDICITRKMVPIPRRVSSFLVVVFIHVNRKEEEEGETEQQQQFTKGCNILHRLQVYHLTLTFIIHNKYTSSQYLYTYMHIYYALI